MNTVDLNKDRPWQQYHGPNLGYVQEQYEQYLVDPDSVEPTFRDMFARFGAPPAAPVSQDGDEANVSGSAAPDLSILKKVVAADKLVWNIRTFGHLAADIDPLGLGMTADTRLLEPETYQLTKEDLMKFPASLIWENAPEGVVTGWDAIQRLRQAYTGPVAYEFSHVHEESERDWLNSQAESAAAPLTDNERIALLKKLMQVEQFEAFLHRTFVGQKRFSIEGVDVLVPVIDEIIRTVIKSGTSNILIGMAHRGRLNVLAHILEKPYEKIFSEFHHSPNKELIPSEGSIGINYGWTGDVKYHLGADRDLQEGEAVRAHITLANNPSHLEYVNSVVEGFTRAAQEQRNQPGYPVQDVDKAVAIQIHGDAAFPGEGIVAETLNFSKLDGYQNGGSIHIIANNRLGFTTDSKDSRSTYYASDLAKGYEIPIIHVNADNPEACYAAARLASAYRLRFKKDFLIDLIGYRRYGHNEMDDPEVTQPLMYDKVRKHPTVSELYGKQLQAAGIVSAEQIEQLLQEVVASFQQAYEKVKEQGGQDHVSLAGQPPVDPQSLNLTTAVPVEKLREINEALLKRPEGFKVYPKLQRILERRATALDEGEKVDWALAETLAFATILADGKPIRLSGQDSERGTFAHRHVILHDRETGETYSPLHTMPQARASFAVHNSPLTEAAVLGFEYGYNVYAPETFVLWEAQYGDFANAAQVIIDQFISAGRSKWSQKSSIALLLPHGYEGQGPEHSSARLERFLQLSAEENWTVANLTSSAQYFHLLRRQAAIGQTEAARPLVLMSPKSLIRNPRVGSPVSAFAEGTFKPVLEQEGFGDKAGKVERLILCSGKVALDLEEALDAQKDKDWSWLHVARVEQLYPFPKSEIEQILGRYSKLKEIVWVQEEPQNMGSWRYIEPHLRAVANAKTVVRYIGRPDRSSPASGHQDVHSFEQKAIVSIALNQNSLKPIPLGR